MMLAFCFFTTKDALKHHLQRRLCGKIYVISGKRPVADCRFTNHFQYPGCVRRGGAMMYYVTWILGTPEVFVLFSPLIAWVT